MFFPSVSIVITTFNRKKYLETVLPQYRKINYPNYKIIVCDDCSTDGTQEYLKSNSYLYDSLFLSKVNLGVTNSRNQGVNRNPADFYALVDDDAVHDPNWLKEAISVLTTWHDIGAVTTQRPLYELLEKEDILSALDLQLIRKNDVKAMLVQFIGSCMLFSHEVWEKVGAMSSHPEKRCGISRYSARISKAKYKVARTFPAYSESIDMPSHPLSLRFNDYNEGYTKVVAPADMQTVDHYNDGINRCIEFTKNHFINEDGLIIKK